MGTPKYEADFATGTYKIDGAVVTATEFFSQAGMVRSSEHIASWAAWNVALSDDDLRELTA